MVIPSKRIDSGKDADKVKLHLKVAAGVFFGLPSFDILNLIVYLTSFYPVHFPQNIPLSHCHTQHVLRYLMIFINAISFS